MGRSLSLAAVFLLGVILALTASFVAQFLSDPPRPAILRDLPRMTAEIDGAWDDRLAQAFPPGTSQSTLIAKLSRGGFVFRKSDGRLHARYEVSSLFCIESYYVDWTVGDSEAVQTVDGSHHLSCL
jgi:hypothetical protein